MGISYLCIPSTQQGNKTEEGGDSFAYNKCREEVPLIATGGEKRKTPPLRSQRKERNFLANASERRGHASPCLAKDSLFRMRPNAVEHPSLRTTCTCLEFSPPPPATPSTSSPTLLLPLGVFVLPWIRVKTAASMAEYPAAQVGWGSM